MLVEVKWRKIKVRGHYELWGFWSCGKYFGCICSSHKKRSPRRIFKTFAEYRPLRNFESPEDGSSFLVEKKFIDK